MRYFELTTLDTVIFGGAKAAPAIEKWVSQGEGRLCGAWNTDLGHLNRVYVLRAFDEIGTLLDERERALHSDNPFGCMEYLADLCMDSYCGVDFLPDAPSGHLGPIYEIRTYTPRIARLRPLLAAWAQAVPERLAYSRLAVAMYALDGRLRYVQIWPYASLDERSRARQQSMADGKWPPRGGPDCVLPKMTSEIAYPLAFSPMQ